MQTKESCEWMDWVDAVKGIGIICVILGHMQVPLAMHKLIYSFHMPLFFIVSGMLYRGEWGKAWILRKIDRLLVPYLVYSLLLIFLFRLYYGADLCSLFVAVALGRGVHLTWFFFALFFAECLGAGIRRLEGGLYVGVILSYILGTLFRGTAIWCYSLMFWLLGSYLSGLFKEIARRLGKNELLVLCVFLFSIALPLTQLQDVDMSQGRFGNPFFSYVWR